MYKSIWEKIEQAKCPSLWGLVYTHNVRSPRAVGPDLIYCCSPLFSCKAFLAQPGVTTLTNIFLFTGQLSGHDTHYTVYCMTEAAVI